MHYRCRFRIASTVALLSLAFCSSGSAQSTQNPLGLKPDHATAAVADVDRAVRWYQDMLGFKVVNRGERPNGMHYADLEIPGYGIGLVQKPSTPAAPTAGRSGWIHIVFSVPDPARAFATLKAKGAQVSTRGNPPPAQITTFLLHDSDGNEIEIVQEH